MGSDISKITDQQIQQNQQTNAFDSLGQHYKDAINLRIKGYKYEDIASIITKNGHKVEDQTIRTWFSEDGKCYLGYNWKKQILREEHEQYYKNDFEIQIRDIGREAIIALRNEISKGKTPAIIKALELTGIANMTKNFQIPQENEGIILLRQIIQNGRDIARKKRGETSR